MSASRAEDGAYLALADVATTAAATNTEYRVIGGHMVTLHMARYPFAGLLARQTADADVGFEPLVLASSGMIDALYGMGYRLSAGNRFVREFDGLTLAIDVLVPADTSRVHHSRPVAGLFADEVPGLRYAIARPPLLTELRVRLTTGPAFDVTTTIPDIVSALCLKALAYQSRLESRDAIDVWRLLEVAYADGLSRETWPSEGTPRDAADVLQRCFLPPNGSGTIAAASGGGPSARVRALAAHLLPLG